MGFASLNPSYNLPRNGSSGNTLEQAMRRLGLSTLLLLAAVTSASADVRILSSPGGKVDDYLKLFAMLRATGERIVIDGPCLSACTLVLSTIPPERICMTKRAVLGFHAPRLLDRRGRLYAAPEFATELVTSSYPETVRDWIARHGGLTSKAIYLRGRELAALYPRCR
jgi:hypothetical protein